ncbi:MAG: tRNA lysidine(34) synthetase TilS, partial [Ktedonobacterales bacterium]
MARGVTTRIERAVARFAHTHHLWSHGATVVLGVSGGPDSLCLLGALHALVASGQVGAPGRLVVAHLDHGMRGEAGAEDAAWVRAFTADLGIDCVTERVDVPELARSERRSLEEAGRHARYAFLRRVLDERQAERICVGHTSDDQLETLVMNWLRGSGLAGLSGMAPLTKDIARPLLSVTRAQTVAYCAARDWEPREDASNADVNFRRNRVRVKLIPALRQYNPNLRETLVRNAALLTDDADYLTTTATAAWRELAEHDADAVSFAVESLRETPLAVRHRLLQRAFAHLASGGQALEAVHV